MSLGLTPAFRYAARAAGTVGLPSGNWAAVLAAAAAFFAIGYVIHMRLVDLEAWNVAKHIDKVELSAKRMASGMILPLATAIGLAVPFRWGMSQALPMASDGS